MSRGGGTITRSGFTINYRCYDPTAAIWFLRCKEKDFSKCMRCQYCEATMRAEQATKLIDAYERLKLEKRYGFNQENNGNGAPDARSL